MQAVIDSMRSLHAKIEEGGPNKAKEKHIARGKMLPREYAINQRLCPKVAVAKVYLAGLQHS